MLARFRTRNSFAVLSSLLRFEVVSSLPLARTFPSLTSLFHGPLDFAIEPISKTSALSNLEPSAL
jgi:hypothetical protein